MVDNDGAGISLWGIDVRAVVRLVMAEMIIEEGSEVVQRVQDVGEIGMVSATAVPPGSSSGDAGVMLVAVVVVLV